MLKLFGLIFLVSNILLSFEAYAVQDPGPVSKFLEKRCPKGELPKDAAMALACEWPDLAQRVFAFENGEGPEIAHARHLRGHHQLYSAKNGDDVIPLDYFSYIQSIQRLQISSLYLLNKLNHSWIHDQSAALQEMAVEFLVERIPGGGLSAALFRMRLHENAAALWGWNLVPNARQVARRALLKWLTDFNHFRLLEESLLGRGGNVASKPLVAFISSILSVPLPGALGTSPIEFLFRSRKDNRGRFFIGLQDPRLASDWLTLYSAEPNPECIAEGARGFRDELRTDSLVNISDCSLLADAIRGTSDGRNDLTVQSLVEDCSLASTETSSGINFWQSVGVGFEAYSPSLRRLTRSIASQSLSPTQARQWLTLQQAFWLMTLERSGISTRFSMLMEDFSVLSAEQIFFELSRQGETLSDFMKGANSNEEHK